MSSLWTGHLQWTAAPVWQHQQMAWSVWPLFLAKFDGLHNHLALHVVVPPKIMIQSSWRLGHLKGVACTKGHILNDCSILTITGELQCPHIAQVAHIWKAINIAGNNIHKTCSIPRKATLCTRQSMYFYFYNKKKCFSKCVFWQSI